MTYSSNSDKFIMLFVEALKKEGKYSEKFINKIYSILKKESSLFSSSSTAEKLDIFTRLIEEEEASKE